MKPMSFLWPFSIPYGAIVGIRNRLYDMGLLSSEHSGVPTISVGNISAGGTGKTPFVLTLIDQIERTFPGKNYKVAIVSRGYGRSTKGTQIVSDGKRILGDPFSCGDEPYMLAESARKSIVIVDEDRFRGSKLAVEQYKAKILILDDGFQRRQVKRDLDIVLLDGRNPLGNRLLLPAGFLREPVSSLTRADLIVLSKSVGDDDELAQRCKKMAELTQKPVIATRLVSQYFRRVGKSEIEGIEQIKGKRVAVFGGIARPQSLYETIEGLGANVVSFTPLRDHSTYSKSVLDLIATKFVSNKAEWLVTTEKDAGKLPPVLKLLPVYSLVVRNEIASGVEVVENLLRQVIHYNT